MNSLLSRLARRVFWFVAVPMCLTVVILPQNAASEEPRLPDRGLNHNQPADLIKVGHRLHIDKKWDGPNLSEWEVIVTCVVGDEFDGVAREVAGTMRPAGLPLRTWSNLAGTISNGQYKFRITSSGIPGFWEEGETQCESCLGSLSRLAFGNTWNSGQTEVNYSTIWKVDQIGNEQLAKIVQQNKEALDLASRKWQSMRAEVERLRLRGHSIQPMGYLENGEVELDWSQAILGSEKGKYDRLDYHTDLNVFEELANLPYVHSIYLGKALAANDLRHLKALQHVGWLSFYEYNGEGISTLADGPKIDCVSFVKLTQNGLAELANIRSLKCLRLNFCEQRFGDGDAQGLKGIAGLPNLVEWSLARIPGRDPNGLTYLTGAKQLRRLFFRGDLNDSSLDAIKDFPQLESLTLHAVDPEKIGRIENNSLQRFRVGHCWNGNDTHLDGWDLKSIIRLDLPFWVPGDHAEYVRRLPTMDPREQDCYQAIRTINEIDAAIRKGNSMREYFEVHASGLLIGARYEERLEFIRPILKTINEIVNLGTARSSPPNPASLRSPVGVSEFRDVNPRTRRIRSLRAEWMLGWVVVSGGAAQRKGCVVEGQMGAAGIAVGGGCVSAVLAQLDCTRRGWSCPPLGLLPQNAGQSEGQS